MLRIIHFLPYSFPGHSLCIGNLLHAAIFLAVGYKFALVPLGNPLGNVRPNVIGIVGGFQSVGNCRRNHFKLLGGSNKGCIFDPLNDTRNPLGTPSFAFDFSVMSGSVVGEIRRNKTCLQ